MEKRETIINILYVLFNFLFDLLMISITGGLWLVYLLFKYLRTRQDV